MGAAYLEPFASLGVAVLTLKILAITFIVYLLFGIGLIRLYAYPGQSRREKAKNALILPGLMLASLISLTGLAGLVIMMILLEKLLFWNHQNQHYHIDLEV